MKKYKNLKEKAYFFIKDKIIRGELKPNAHIEEKELVENLKISKTPIREALNSLHQEGWLTIIPRKGIFISNITLKDIRDIFQVREFIEPQILTLAFDNLEDEKLLEFKGYFENIENYPLEEIERIDNEFHQYILFSSNNQHVIKMMENVYEHNQRLRLLIPTSEVRIESAKDEHISIVNALIEKDLKGAIIELKKHVMTSQEDYFKNISKLKL